MTAMAFAKAGDTTSALQLVQQLREKYPLNTLLRDRDLPSIQAEVYLHKAVLISLSRPLSGRFL